MKHKYNISTESDGEGKYPSSAVLLGAAAGFINGLLGTGGGVLLVFALGALKKSGGSKDAFASALAVTLPVSAVSAMIYFSSSGIEYGAALRFLIPAAIGGAAGAFITDKIKPQTLKLIFAAVTAVAGINMLMR